MDSPFPYEEAIAGLSTAEGPPLIGLFALTQEVTLGERLESDGSCSMFAASDCVDSLKIRCTDSNNSLFATCRRNVV
jgi:hypothetical protein